MWIWVQISSHRAMWVFHQY